MSRLAGARPQALRFMFHRRVLVEGSAVVAGFASLVGVLAFEPVSRSIAETITLMAPSAALGAIIAGALMHSFTDRLIRAEYVLAEAELMSGVRPKPRARFVHRRLQTRPG